MAMYGILPEVGSGILKRTVLYKVLPKWGIRFHEFAIVQTTNGPMLEPFIPGDRFQMNHPVRSFDSSDMMARIDEMRAFGDNYCQFGSGEYIHSPSMGIKTGP